MVPLCAIHSTPSTCKVSTYDATILTYGTAHSELPNGLLPIRTIRAHTAAPLSFNQSTSSTVMILTARLVYKPLRNAGQISERLAKDPPSLASSTHPQRLPQITNPFQLLLTKVNTFLMPFIQRQPANAGSKPSPTADVRAGSEPAAGVQGVAVDQPPTEEGELSDHHGLDSGEGGVNDLHEAGVGRGELGSTLRFHPERGEELNSGFFSGGGQEEQATPTPRQISRASSRARSRAKRIRITGALGEFLDGSGMWNDINFMEAERRFIQAAAAPSGSQDIQIQNDDIHSSDVTRQPQQQLQDYRTDQRVQHGQQGEEESKGGEGEGSD